MHPEVARRWGLVDRERVHLQNQDGVRSAFAAPVRITNRIRPDAVYLVHGYGHRSKHLKFAYGRGIDSAELTPSTTNTAVTSHTAATRLESSSSSFMVLP